MKKILIVLCFLVCFSSCTKKEEEIPEVHYSYEVTSEKVDMSAYEGVSSTNHNFRLIRVSEFFKVIDNKSSGIFYLGRDNCECCQKVCKYLNEVAMELGVTVYYIDVYDPIEPLTDRETIDKLHDYLYPILGTDDEGNKVLLTPQVFSVIDGEYYASQICFDNYKLDDVPTDSQIEKFKDSYRYIMRPFVSE